jgi:hypothetical protein
MVIGGAKATAMTGSKSRNPRPPGPGGGIHRLSGFPGGFYQKAVRVLGLGLVEEAVGETRMRAPESRARYLSAILSEWMEERVNAPTR